jgi:hypothetical protein
LLLEQHAKSHGFRNIAHYTDDGLGMSVTARAVSKRRRR